MDEPLMSEYAHDPEMSDLIIEFLAGLAETCRQLDAYLSAGDLAQVRRIGHQMKGAGTGYGYPLLTSVGAALEHATNTDSDVSENVQRQAELFRQVCARAIVASTAVP